MIRSKLLPFAMTTLLEAAVLLPASAAEDAAAAPVLYQKIAIAADHAAASQAGLEVFQAGGNVVDAAVAVGFALSVVRPESAGIGGGGFMVIWDAKQQRAMTIDYRERAPAAATRDMFLDADGKAIAADSQLGHRAVAVPHHVAGLCYVNQKYGQLPLAVVMAPAIRLAEQGVVLDTHAAAFRREMQTEFARNPERKQRFAAFYQQYLAAGEPFAAGQRVTSPQADLLKKIAKSGQQAFYEGPAAEAFVAEMQRGGGLITAADLAGVAPTERPPLTLAQPAGTLLTMPPPSSGGIAFCEVLNTLAAYETAHPELANELKNRDSLEYRHALAEAMKHAFADRATYLGDPDVAAIPTATLISSEYGTRLAARIQPDSVLPLEAYGRAAPLSDAGTTHYSIIDAEGNAVAATETINLTYGSLVVVPETGLLLNNEMDDFAAAPGQPNAFGLRQSETAAIGPGRRPLSSMTPTILVNNGKAVLAVGASGGPRIITATLQVYLNRVRSGFSAQAAVDAPRQHHQWLPNVLLLEQPIFTVMSKELKQLGHEVNSSGGLGVSQLVLRTNAGLSAASDPRKGGSPAGE